MTRKDRLKQVKLHPMTRGMVARLTRSELNFLDGFVARHGDTPLGELNTKVNRLFVDDKIKPKNHMEIWAILSELLSAELYDLRKDAK